MYSFETRRLIIRDYVQNDFEEYYKLKSDTQTMYYLQDIQLYSREEAEEEFDGVLKDIEEEDRKFYFFSHRG